MGTPIFKQQNTALAGVFTANNASLIFDKRIAGALVQAMTMNFAQSVTRMFDLITSQQNRKSNQYYVAGRTQGNMALSRVIGPNAIIVNLYREFGDICQALTNNMRLDLSGTEPCEGQIGSVTYIMSGIALESLTVGLNANDSIINEQTRCLFTGLEYEAVGV